MGRKSRAHAAARAAAARGADARAGASPGIPVETVSAKAAPMGLPGDRGHVIVHNEFVAGDPRNQIPVGGGPGRYRVIMTLARPGYSPVGEWEFSFDPGIPGDSHLAIASPALQQAGPSEKQITAVKIYAVTDGGQMVFTGHPNAKGYLGRVETELDANTLMDAEQRAYRTLAPSLSSWSAQLDIPLRIWRIHVTAIETGAIQINVVHPFPETAPLGGSGAMSAEFRGFTSLYREALESNSPVYQYLCLFKIAEGILNRRARLAKAAKATGRAFARAVERVPNQPIEFETWLNAIYPGKRIWDEMSLHSIFLAPTRGRRFGDLIHHELTDLRNEVAHALSDKTGVIAVSADETLHISRVLQWVPLTKCIVRRMLKNEFPDEYLPYLREDGNLQDPSNPAVTKSTGEPNAETNA